MSPPRVVNLNKSRHDVYIGRGSKWGNPFILGADGNREEVIANYRKYILKQPELLADLPELTGKRLGCFCAPSECHGDILVELWEKLVNKKKPYRLRIGGRVYISQDAVPLKRIKKRYHVELYNEEACAKCDNLPNRPNLLCEQCPAYGGNYKLWSKTNRGGHDYWVLPIGDIQYIKNKLIPDRSDFDIKVALPAPKFDNPIRFTGRLYNERDRDEHGNPRVNQQEVCETWLKHKNGAIKAQPRSGKTVMAVYCACELGVKTLIIAHQYELLNQFRETFVGSETSHRRAMTNVAQLEKKNRKPIFKIIEKMSDFDQNYDIAAITYQSFIRDFSRIKQYVNGRFGLLIVDEYHQANADAYCRTTYDLNMPYRLSLSATDKRKDGREVIAERLMGPVVAESKAFSLLPEISTFACPVIPSYNYKSWQGALKWVSNDPDVAKEVVKAVFRDLRDGHTSIIIPVYHKAHMNLLEGMINQQAKMANSKRGEKWPKNLAVCLHGQANRKSVLERVDSGKPTVLVAIISMIKQGIDMRLPTKMHCLIPMSANYQAGAPMFRQLSYRCCTPFPGKRQPEITMWIYDIGLFCGITNGLFWNEIVPGLKRENMLYKLTPGTFEILKDLRNKGRGGRGGSFRGSSGGWT